MNKKIIIIIAVIIIFALGIFLGYSFNKEKQDSVYIMFLMEVYDKIQNNFWEQMPDETLTNLFKLAAEQTAEKPFNLSSNDKQGLKQLLNKAIKKDKEQSSVKIASLVLNSLHPFGRSSLYTAQDEQGLKDTIQNINEQTGEPDPTVEHKQLTSDISYIRIKQFSPNTLDEFQKAALELDVKGGTTLILDLRANIGGSIDLLPYFLGPFIGYDQYAYEFYHQGEKTPFKTLTGWLNTLVRYKKVLILVDENTQSTAELMAAVLKRYNVGILVGRTTKGWGTIEKVFSIENQMSSDRTYSMFLAHSLTLRDDNQPIEGKGVDPVINMGNQGWEAELNKYFHYPQLIDILKSM